MHRNYDYILKVCLLGESAVGKTCLLRRYADDQFDQSTLATIGVDFRFKSLNINDKYVKLQLWDTAGQQRFRSVVQSYYRDADAVVMVYDSTNGHSFAMIEQYWLQEVSKNTKPECMFFLFANKCDEKGGMEANERQWCEMKQIRCFQVSAKTGMNVGSSIQQIVAALIERRPPIEHEKLVMTLGENSPPPKKGCCQ